MMSAVSLLDETLRCPRCGMNYLHQGEVEVFVRHEEDGLSTAVLIDKHGAPKVGQPERNPSGRRDGLRISFTCECCHDENSSLKPWSLAIYQHKGVTMLVWDEPA